MVHDLLSFNISKPKVWGLEAKLLNLYVINYLLLLNNLLCIGS
jgi:hypothetical protein